MSDTLSDQIEAMRRWWAQHVHDGLTLDAEAVANMTACLGRFKEKAERYEDKIADGRTLMIAARTEALRRRHDLHGAIDNALAMKGLSEKVMPASALLTEEHLAAGNIELHPASWTLNRRCRPGARP